MSDTPPPPPPPPPPPATPPPPMPAQPGGGAAASTNGFAIASLVLGILGIVTCGYTFFIAPLLAVIFGVIAKRQIAERGQGGQGLAQWGFILGLIGLVVSILLIVLVFVAGIFGATTQ